MKFIFAIFIPLFIYSCSQTNEQADKGLETNSTVINHTVAEKKTLLRSKLHEEFWVKRIKEAQETRDTGYGLVNNERQLLFDSDSLLNVVYKDLTKTLPEQQFDSLKTTQIEWIKVKDKNFKKIWEEKDPMIQGEIELTIKYSSQEEIVEKKLLELINLLKEAESK